MKHKLYIPALLILLSIQAPHAIAAEISPATASVKESVNELVTVRDNDMLTTEEKAQQELDARKKVIGEVLSLSITEVKNLEKDLKSLSLKKDSREEGMRTAFMTAFSAYTAYFNQEKTKNDSITTIAESKALAQEIKTYREEIYNKQTQIIVEFVLLFRSEQALATTQARYEKIAADIANLEKKGYISEGKFVEPLKQAEKLIKDAIALTAQAKQIILASKEDTDESASDETSTSETSTVALKAETPTARALIVKSFENIKDSYLIFLQIGTDVRTMLGIK